MNAFEVKKSIREEYTLNFMWLFANKEQKEAIELVNKDCPEQKILWLIDKIDPIVNIWRYMYIYRDIIKIVYNIYFSKSFITQTIINSISQK